MPAPWNDDPSQARAWAAALPSTRWDVAGLALALEVDDDLTPGLHRLLGALPPAAGPATARLRVGIAGELVGEASPDLTVTVDDDGTVDIRHGRGGTVLVGAAAPDALVTVPAGAAAASVRLLVSMAIGVLLESAGVTLLHAGTLAMGDGAALVAGATGTGKSTAVAAARTHGRRTWGDDLAALRPTPGGLEVTGIPRPVSVPSDVAGRPGDPEDRDRVLLAPEEPGAWQPVRAVVAVAHGAASRLTRLRAGAALAPCFDLLFTGLVPGRAEAWYPHAAELARTGVWRLDHHPDPAVRLAKAAARLDDLETELDPTRTRG